MKPVRRAEGRESYSARRKGVDAADQKDRKGKQIADNFCMKQRRRPDSGVDIKFTKAETKGELIKTRGPVSREDHAAERLWEFTDYSQRELNNRPCPIVWGPHQGGQADTKLPC